MASLALHRCSIKALVALTGQTAFRIVWLRSDTVSGHSVDWRCQGICNEMRQQ